MTSWILINFIVALRDVMGVLISESMKVIWDWLECEFWLRVIDYFYLSDLLSVLNSNYTHSFIIFTMSLIIRHLHNFHHLIS